MAKNDETLMTMVCDVFSGPLKAWSYYVLVLGLVFTGIFIYSLVKFLSIGEFASRVFWGVPLILSAIFLSMVKIWFWIQMAKNSIIKALKE